MTRSGLPIHIGSEDFAARLGRLERAVASGDLPLEAVASVDVSLRDRLVVVPSVIEEGPQTNAAGGEEPACASRAASLA